MKTDKTSTKISSTSTTLQQIITTYTVQLLKEGRLKDLSLSFVGYTVKNAIENGVPLVVLSKTVNTQLILQFIDLELRTLAGRVNIDSRLNLQPAQVPEIAQNIYDNFKTETLEDFSIAFRRGVFGFYGEIFRIDGAVVIRWIQLYLDEKYTFIENEHQKAKTNENDQVNYKEFQERLTRERAQQNSSRQAEIDRRRADAAKVLNGEIIEGYHPLSQEDLDRRELHSQWIHENYDLDGNKREGFKEESEWLKSRTEKIEP